MNRLKPGRNAKKPKVETISADQIVFFKDRGGRRMPAPALNGNSNRRTTSAARSKRDRLRPLVAAITHSITVARYVDPKGLDDVVELLHKAYSKALDHQYNR